MRVYLKNLIHPLFIRVPIVDLWPFRQFSGPILLLRLPLFLFYRYGIIEKGIRLFKIIEKR